jgi:GxxExxY protein
MKEPSQRVDEIASLVIGAAIEVHKVLGPGYLESVYEEALMVELQDRGMSIQRQKSLTVTYKGHEVGQARLDFVAEDCLVIEVKAVEALLPVHRAQVISYLRATGYSLGLLINFNEKLLRDGIRRVVVSE